MPVPFVAGLVVVSKVACVGGMASGVSSLVWQAAEGCLGEPSLSKAEKARRLRRKKSVEVSRHEQHKWIQHMGNINAKAVLKSFSIGVITGTLAGAVWAGTHGIATTSVPLSTEPFMKAVGLAGTGILLWTPAIALLTRTDREVEHGVPFFFFDGMVLGTTWFTVTSYLGFKDLARMGLTATAGFTATMISVFVHKYGYFQSSKRVLHTGPVTNSSHRWLITAGLVSGTVLAVALAVTPFYHPGRFLVWGITNPATMYTMCIAAEAEIESEQMVAYKKTVNADLLQQRRFIRALLPMAGLPFGYFGDRDDVSEAVKIGLAGIGTMALGANLFLYHDEWSAFLIDEDSHEPCIPHVLPYESAIKRVEEEEEGTSLKTGTAPDNEGQ